jgi:hypothetical protein
MREATVPARQLAFGAQSMNTEVTRELLQTSPLAELPGWEMRLFQITYPLGADASNHSHPVVGVGFVLAGAVVSAPSP